MEQPRCAFAPHSWEALPEVRLCPELLQLLGAREKKAKGDPGAPSPIGRGVGPSPFQPLSANSCLGCAKQSILG